MGIGSKNKIKTEGGMSSMTDLVFLLLIFFIIMSLMSNPEPHVPVPVDPDLKPEVDPVTATLVVTENNLYVVFPGGNMETPMTFEEVTPLIEEVVDNSGEDKVKIEGHQDAEFEAVYNAMALAQVKGWDPVLSFKR